MNFSISQQDSIQIVKFSNLINEHQKRMILDELQTKIEKGFNQVIVDLSLEEFMNSVGLNFLISAMTRTRENGGEMVLANASNQVEKLLEITKLKSLMQMEGSVEDAIEKLD